MSGSDHGFVSLTEAMLSFVLTHTEVLVSRSNNRAKLHDSERVS